MENTPTSQTNNDDNALNESILDLYQSSSHQELLVTDCGFDEQIDKFLLKEINELEQQMTENIENIASILADATVAFATANGSVATIMNNVIQIEPISPLVVAINSTLN